MENLEEILKDISKLSTQKQEIYNSFLMPWNIVKGEKLGILDSLVDSNIQQIIDFLCADIAKLKTGLQIMTDKNISTQDALAKEKLISSSLQDSLESQQNEFSDLTERYESLVAQIENLEKELLNARTKKSRKRNKAV
jgi:chromosome segregation ATPase